jgi:nucleolin
MIDGRECRIDYATVRPPREEKKPYQSDRPPNPPATTLWVGNLSFDINEDGLWEEFGAAGQVSSVRLPTDRETGAPKG